MLAYILYFVLVVGLSILLTASFRRLRGEQPPTREDNAEFDRRIEAIERRYGRRQDDVSAQMDFQKKDEGQDEGN